MHSHIGCICSTFLHCVFSNESLTCVHERMHNHTGCICLTFHRHVFSNAPSRHLHKMMHSHTDCIYLTFLQCAFSNESSNCPHDQMQNHTGYICLTFLHGLFPSDCLHWSWLEVQYPFPASKKPCLLCKSHFKLREIEKINWFASHEEDKKES